jgi:hypothetical protein
MHGLFIHESFHYLLLNINRIQSIPRYPDLKHFPNGITELKYITGKEHGIILKARLIAFLLILFCTDSVL